MSVSVNKVRVYACAHMHVQGTIEIAHRLQAEERREQRSSIHCPSSSPPLRLRPLMAIFATAASALLPPTCDARENFSHFSFEWLSRLSSSPSRPSSSPLFLASLPRLSSSALSFSALFPDSLSLSWLSLPRLSLSRLASLTRAADSLLPPLSTQLHKQGTDDVPFTNTGCEIKTPTLSRLAAEGVVLDNYYVRQSSEERRRPARIEGISRRAAQGCPVQIPQGRSPGPPTRAPVLASAARVLLVVPPGSPGAGLPSCSSGRRPPEPLVCCSLALAQVNPICTPTRTSFMSGRCV